MKSRHKLCKLDSICTFINGDRGKNYPSRKEFVNEGIPFINAGHIEDLHINFQDMNYIPESKFDKLGSGKVQKDDVLFCLRGSLGKCGIIEINKGAIASSLVILRPDKDKVIPKYLLYALNSNSIKKQIIKANNGSTQPNLSAKSVKNFVIYLPSIEEQLKIVEILDTALEIIKIRDEQLEKLDTLVQSLFCQLFGNFSSTALNWKEKAIGDVTDFIDYRGKTPKKESDEIPFITAKNVKFGYFSPEPQEYISNETYSKIMTRGIPKINDILFTTEAPLGNVCRIPNITGLFAVGQRLIVMVCKDMIMPEYLQYCLMQQRIQYSIYKRSTGSTVKGIRSKELVKIKIPVPDIDRQIKFSKYINEIDEQKQIMNSLMQKSLENYYNLIQRAFDGELLGGE